MAVLEQFAGNILALTQTVTTNPKVLIVSQTFVLRQSALHNIRTRTVQHFLRMSDKAEVRTSVKNVSVGDFLGMSQRAKKAPIYVEAFDFFFPYHTAQGSRGGTASSFLNLSQSVLVYKPKTGKHTFNLTQTVGLKIVRHRLITQTFGLNQFANQFLYNINRGVAINYPPQVPDIKVTFQYFNFVLTIPPPDFGNTLKLEFSRVSQKTRGNDSIIFRPEIWPRSRILTLKFSYLTELESYGMKYLLKESLGKHVTYLDHLGRTWSGIILTPGAPVIQTMRNVFEVQLEYQAERVG